VADPPARNGYAVDGEAGVKPLRGNGSDDRRRLASEDVVT
jgi:hypothetical protein